MNEIREFLEAVIRALQPDEIERSHLFNLNYESFDLAGDVGQTLVVYTAQAGSPSQVALDQLARGITERAATR